jgi:hypothetical protein
MPSYRLNASIAGVEQSATGMRIVQIAAGEVLSLPEIEQDRGLVELVLPGRHVAVFAQDLRRRGSRVDESPSGAAECDQPA